MDESLYVFYKQKKFQYPFFFSLFIVHKMHYHFCRTLLWHMKQIIYFGREWGIDNLQLLT